MSNNHAKQYHVFLSHSTGDKPHVERIAERLEDEAGLKPFLDKWHLVPGESWQEALEEALDVSETCAVFLGPMGLGPWENEEMRSALDERVKDKSLRVIPVLLPGADLKDEKLLPRFLRRLTWVDFGRGVEEQEPFTRLVAGIRGEKPGRLPAHELSGKETPSENLKPLPATKSWSGLFWTLVMLLLLISNMVISQIFAEYREIAFRIGIGEADPSSIDERWLKAAILISLIDIAVVIWVLLARRRRRG